MGGWWAGGRGKAIVDRVNYLPSAPVCSIYRVYYLHTSRRRSTVCCTFGARPGIVNRLYKRRNAENETAVRFGYVFRPFGDYRAVVAARVVRARTKFHSTDEATGRTRPFFSETSTRSAGRTILRKCRRAHARVTVIFSGPRRFVRNNKTRRGESLFVFFFFSRFKLSNARYIATYM